MLKPKLKVCSHMFTHFSSETHILSFITAITSFPLSSFHIKVLVILYSLCDKTHPSCVFSYCLKHKSTQLSLLKCHTFFSYPTSFST